MATTDYVPFAAPSPTNPVMSLPAYDAAAPNGVAPGTADPTFANRAWRQASMIAAAVASFTSNILGIPILDDGNLSALVTNFTNAVEAAAGSAIRAARVVTSGPVTMLLTDYAIGLDVSASLVVDLPSGAANGQEFVVEDVAGTLSGSVVATVTPPGGTTIGGRATYVMNESFQSCTLRYYATGTVWSVKSS